MQDTSSGNNGSFADQLLCTALDIGEHILLCGGDIHRVEDTITRICTAFGAAHTEAFTITSVIMASVRMPDGSYSSQMRRVYECSTNLAELEALNDISRRLCRRELTLEEAQRAVKAAKDVRPYPLAVYFLGAVLAAGGFAVFFGGSAADGAAAALVGVLITLLDRLSPAGINRMAHMVLNSFAAGVCAIVLVWLGVGQNTDKVMIGSIMLLIPGLAVGTSMQDLLGGDLISGAMRFLQSILLAVMIAFGFALSMYALKGVLRPDSGTAVPGDAVTLLTAVLGTTGFAVLFSTRPRHIPFAALGGLIACVVYLVLYERTSADLFLANMFGALAGTWYSHACARLRKAPRNVFMTACMIPLVPGGSLYYAMSSLLSQNGAAAAQYGADTLNVALGIAAGVVLASVTVFFLKSLLAALNKRRSRR